MEGRHGKDPHQIPAMMQFLPLFILKISSHVCLHRGLDGRFVGCFSRSPVLYRGISFLAHITSGYHPTTILFRIIHSGVPMDMTSKLVVGRKGPSDAGKFRGARRLVS